MTEKNPHIHCQDCSMSELCLPHHLDPQGLERLDTIIQRHKPLHKRDILIRAGAPLKWLYAVRSGSLKSYIIDEHGREQIIDFHLPGDLVGFDALSTGQHRSFAQSLETTMLCEIPIDSLDDLAVQLPALRRQMLRLMSDELFNGKQLVNTLNNRTAPQRLAFFLYSLSQRFAARGLSASSFRLTMTRADIASYLGLSVETVSRILSSLQDQSIIRVEQKLVHIDNITGLMEAAG